ncbi:T cell receptor beta chain MC.7.G5-like [Pristis pectinata]|uniref:T cell receptor beta chain MC.7.G5-like n=1 Tax=Pristis pectinata TaxID=685728 RepID=UPI00223E4363|nr:T cell receptor beta chain MC.7.G5-like [Pristis pectinata]
MVSKRGRHGGGGPKGLQLCRTAAWRQPKRHRVLTSFAATVYTDPQQFGPGTKLTVLDPNLEIKGPKISILQPSEREIRKKSRVTVVCLITDFYPNNVKVQWLVDGEKLLTNDSRIHTDTEIQANKKNSSFHLSSRLILDAYDYSTRSRIACNVQHFQNGSTATEYEGTLNVGIDRCALTNRQILHSIKYGNLTFLILVCKSVLYGLIVSVLACKAKTSYSKRFD